jgi:hypothetical protein
MMDESADKAQMAESVVDFLKEYFNEEMTDKLIAKLMEYLVPKLPVWLRPFSWVIEKVLDSLFPDLVFDAIRSVIKDNA